jgi:membrane protein YqaA with SNARE-associated domain
MSLPQEIEHNVETVLHTKTVDQAKQILAGRNGLWLMSFISFFESALPIPLMTDPFLIAAILVDRANTIKLVIGATLASVLGGLVAYFTVYYFLDVALGLMTSEMLVEFEALSKTAESSIFTLTLVGAITPIPYTISAYVIAALKGSMLLFVIGSIIGRGFRYVVIGYITYRFGPLAVKYTTRYMWWLSAVVLVTIIFGYLFYKMWVA